ncbi:MAG TPA: hypothetical protein VFG62_12415 [Rhodopila sp.]|jgi:hypothetical protein|nr:hypothetical protein [Rhodopila sp.]
MAEAEQTSGPQQPATPPAAATQDASRAPASEMLEAMNRYASTIKERDPTLAQEIASLRSEASDPIRANQRELHHLVAYAAQDAEKALGHQLPLSDATRSEMQRLAGSAPGLENPRMLNLLNSTAGLADRDTVHEVRRAATVIGRQADQNTDSIRAQAEHLEHRVRQAETSPKPAPPPNTAPAGQTASPPHAASSSASGASSSSEEQRQPRSEAPANASAAPRAPNPAQPHSAPQQGGYGQANPAVYQRSALDSILDLMRAGVSAATGPAPWEGQPQPLGERLAAYQARTEAGVDQAGLQHAEKAGRAAIEALDGFRTGEGATIMHRIQSAARSDPDGMAGVLSGMREGGRYQDLRQQFNNALHDETGVARAYDKAAESLARYGEARTGVEEIIARRPDAANLTAKFQQLDAEIGEKAESTPSRREGKSMIEDITKQAAEIIQHAVEALKSVFSRSGASPNRPGPSPS